MGKEAERYTYNTGEELLEITAGRYGSIAENAGREVQILNDVDAIHVDSIDVDDIVGKQYEEIFEWQREVNEEYESFLEDLITYDEVPDVEPIYDVGEAGQLEQVVGKTSYGKSSENFTKPKGWKVGDPIDNLTKAGNEPSWSTVRARYWKNKAYYYADDYSESNLIRMRKGLAPIEPETGASMELHHINGRDISNPHNIDNLLEVWPWEHAEIDPHRFYTGPRPKGE